jgi:hypothetical protein
VRGHKLLPPTTSGAPRLPRQGAGYLTRMEWPTSAGPWAGAQISSSCRARRTASRRRRAGSLR